MGNASPATGLSRALAPASDFEIFVDELRRGRWAFAGRRWEGRVRVLELVPSLDTAPLTRAELRLLDHLARGHTNQEIATRFHAAPSTVCAWTRSLAARFGVQPIDLVLVGALCTSRELASWAHVSMNTHHVSLALEIPREVGDALTTAELEVARHIVDGHSARDIARARHTSERTVANQIANVYRKLRASARRECTLVLHGGARHLWSDVPPPAEPAIDAA